MLPVKLIVQAVQSTGLSPAQVGSSSGALCRLILEPTLASRLAGDYRTGKRLNMRRVIAFVASQFRKDKIWMRRTRPDKRKYQVRSESWRVAVLQHHSYGF